MKKYNLTNISGNLMMGIIALFFIGQYFSGFWQNIGTEYVTLTSFMIVSGLLLFFLGSDAYLNKYIGFKNNTESFLNEILIIKSFSSYIKKIEDINIFFNIPKYFYSNTLFNNNPFFDYFSPLIVNKNILTLFDIWEQISNRDHSIQTSNNSSVYKSLSEAEISAIFLKSNLEDNAEIKEIIFDFILLDELKTNPAFEGVLSDKMEEKEFENIKAKNLITSKALDKYESSGRKIKLEDKLDLLEDLSLNTQKVKELV